MHSNEFWPLVTELFPLVLKIAALIAIIRLTTSALKQTLGDEDAIEKAISDIVKGGITLFLVIPSAIMLWKILEKVSIIATKAVEAIKF